MDGGPSHMCGNYMLDVLLPEIMHSGDRSSITSIKSLLS